MDVTIHFPTLSPVGWLRFVIGCAFTIAALYQLVKMVGISPGSGRDYG